jgi:hypothetical protein
VLLPQPTAKRISESEIMSLSFCMVDILPTVQQQRAGRSLIYFSKFCVVIVLRIADVDVAHEDDGEYKTNVEQTFK